ncbi:MAG: A/G-specific adenine glycosylase, partial [bacterium]
TAAIRRVRRHLLAWGRANFQHFPWRSETDPWRSLVAELLLQRTRAAQVEPVFRQFCRDYPTAEDLARAGEAAATRIMLHLGLRWRGRLLHVTARAVYERGGTPPESLEDLRSLPGVGPYTAAAWLSLHRGQRSVMIDSNVGRWLSRVTGKPYARDPRHVHWVKDLADRLTPRRGFRDYNYAVLDFTMHVCTPRAPRCPKCPLRRSCFYGRAHGTAS